MLAEDREATRQPDDKMNDPKKQVTRDTLPGTRYLVPGARYVRHVSRYMLPGTEYGV